MNEDPWSSVSFADFTAAETSPSSAVVAHEGSLGPEQGSNGVGDAYEWGDFAQAAASSSSLEGQQQGLVVEFGAFEGEGAAAPVSNSPRKELPSIPQGGEEQQQMGSPRKALPPTPQNEDKIAAAPRRSPSPPPPPLRKLSPRKALPLPENGEVARFSLSPPVALPIALPPPPSPPALPPLPTSSVTMELFAESIVTSSAWLEQVEERVEIAMAASFPAVPTIPDSLSDEGMVPVPGGDGGGGAFWDIFGDAAAASGTAEVLRRESFTLSDVLEQDDVLQELAISSPLLEFLVTPETFRQLIDLILCVDSQVNPKLPFVACQLLCLPIARLGNAFFEGERENQGVVRILEALSTPPPLPILSTEYCCRVLVRLTQTHPLNIQAQLVEEPKYFLSVCRNVGRPGCSNVLSTMLEAACTLEVDTTGGNGEAQHSVKRLNIGLANWLLSIGMVEALMGALLPGPDGDSPANAVAILQLVLNLVDRSSPILEGFCRPASRAHIAAAVACYATFPTSFRAGVDVVVKIICSNLFQRNVVAELVVDVWNAVEPFIGSLADLSLPMVGQKRYELVQLCTALSLNGNVLVEERLAALNVPNMIVTLVCHYKTSNMFQATCTHFFSSAFMIGPLQEKLLTNQVAGQLIRRLVSEIDVWPRTTDRGFLLQFCHSLISLRSSNEGVNTFLRESLDWTMHLEERVVAEYEVQRAPLCGVIPDRTIRVSGPSAPLPAMLRKLLSKPLPETPADSSGEGLDFDDTAPPRFGESELEEEGFGDFVGGQEPEPSFRDFVEPEPSFGDFVEPPKKDADVEPPQKDADGEPSFGDFVEPPQKDADEEPPQKDTDVEPSFGEFVEPPQKDADGEPSFGDFVEPPQKDTDVEPSFGEFVEPPQKDADAEPSFGDFAEQSDAFGAFVEPNAFGADAFQQQPDANAHVAEPTASWAAFDDTPAGVAEDPLIVEVAKAEKVFRDVFGNVEKAATADLEIEARALTQARGAAEKEDNEGSQQASFIKGQSLLMETLQITEPPPVVLFAPAPFGTAMPASPSPPTLHVAAAQQQQQRGAAQPFAMASPIVAPVAALPPPPPSELDFSFLTGSQKVSSAAPAAAGGQSDPLKGLDGFLFGTATHADPSLDLVERLSDLSFMLSDVLVLPRPKSDNILLLFE